MADYGLSQVKLFFSVYFCALYFSMLASLIVNIDLLLLQFLLRDATQSAVMPWQVVCLSAVCL